MTAFLWCYHINVNIIYDVEVTDTIDVTFIYDIKFTDINISFALSPN